MKKILFILLAILSLNTFGQGFTIDTVITTNNGISVPAGAQVLWWECSKPSYVVDSALVVDTSITYEVQFYASESALLNGASTIIPVVDGVDIFNYRVVYTRSEFDNLSTTLMFLSLKGKLEESFGVGNVIIN